MFNAILTIFKILFLPLAVARKDMLCVFCMVYKENQILKRNLASSRRRIRFSFFDRLSYALHNKLSDKVKEKILLVKPETVLHWYRKFIKKFWDYSKCKKKPGRPPTPADTRELVLKMKNENFTWGVKRISGELLKLGIELDKRTIARILANFRRKGKIKKTMSWKRFIESHFDSLYATDFCTVTSILGKTFYVLFIIRLKTREIVRMNVTLNPTRFFVQQQFMDWRWDREDEKVYLIHDNANVFDGVDYDSFGIRNMCTCYRSPNMNAYAERFVKSLRREALDYFIIFNQKQLENILKKYQVYFNKYRPHQGINQQVPCGYESRKEGRVVSVPLLSGLHHHYERLAS